MKSFVQVYDRIKQIATNHRQINTFGHGQEWDINTSGTVNYPVFWAVPRGSRIGKGEIGYDFEFIVQDLLEKGYQNLEDGLSDTLRVLTDVISELKFGNNNQAYDGIDIKLSEFTSEPFIEKQDDEVIGWTCRVIIWTDYNYSTCAIPKITETNNNTQSTIPCPMDIESMTTAERLALTPTAAKIVEDTDLDMYFKWSTVLNDWVPF